MTDELLPYDSKELSPAYLDDMIRAIKEKAGIQEARQKHVIRHGVVLIAVFAAIMVLAVSAGAILYWDIFGIFTQSRENARNIAATNTEELAERKNDFLDTIKIPENAAAFPDYTERENEILSALAVPADMVFSYEDRTLHINGYVFDGNCLDVIYDVTYSDKTAGEDDGSEFVFCCEDSQTAVFSRRYILAAKGNTAYCRSRNYLDLPESIGAVEILVSLTENNSDEIPTESFSVKVSENAQSIRLGERMIFENENGDVYLKRLVLSPLGAFMELSESIEYISNFDHNAYPVYVTYKDGTVIDLSDYTGNFEGGAGYMTEDGRIVTDYIIGQNLNIFDIGQISSIQIFNEIIDLQ